MNISKGRYLFALALRADRQTDTGQMGQMVAMQAMATDRTQAIGFGMASAHQKWPAVDGWSNHSVSASHISQVDWLAEALETETL